MKKTKMKGRGVITAADALIAELLPSVSETVPYLVVCSARNGVTWNDIPYGDPRFKDLVRCARSHRGRWSGSQWNFASGDKCEQVVAHARELGIEQSFVSKESADEWRQNCAAVEHSKEPSIRVTELGDGSVLLIQSPGSQQLWHTLATVAQRSEVAPDVRAFARVDAKGKAVGTPDLIAVVGPSDASGAVDDLLDEGYRILEVARAPTVLLHAARDGWLMKIELPLAAHPQLAVLCDAAAYWVGKYPNGVRKYRSTAVCDGMATVECTIAEFAGIAERIRALGGSVSQCDETDEAAATDFAATPAGWDAPASNGYSLFQYQKEGTRFVARSQGRCIIGDEMGAGKTAQAIASAQALGARRILVVAPANARYVWDREIRGWLGDAAHIRHVRSSSDRFDLMEAGDEVYEWVIAGYDQIITRREGWKPATDAEAMEVRRWLGMPQSDDATSRIDLPIESAARAGHPRFGDVARLKKWRKAMARLERGLVTSLDAWQPDLLVVDEAHRVKNSQAKRTSAVAHFSSGARYVLLLTGTPVRNHAGEAANLLKLVDGRAYHHLSDHLHDKRRIKNVLQCLMIRRLKSDVNPELPPQQRQEWPVRVDVPDEYYLALDFALQQRSKALDDGASEAEARTAMRGGLAMARRILGVVKAPVAAELIQQIVEQNDRRCCVVFAWHKDVISTIAELLTNAGLRVGLITGSVPGKRRAEVVDEFQAGRLDVIVANHQAGGEAISLTRADTVVFAEHDWVPGVLQQAEARIHRTGQTAKTCYTYHLLVSDECLSDGVNLDSMLWTTLASKLSQINTLLDEDTQIAGGSVQGKVIDQLLARRGNIRENAAAATTPIPTAIR